MTDHELHTEWHMLPTLYSFRPLKQGRYSAISTAYSPDLGCDVVVKVYDRPVASAKKHKFCTREAVMLHLLNSHGVPHVTQLHAAYHSQERFCLIMEHCALGNMLEALRRLPPGSGLTEQQAAALVAEPLLRSLASMHALGVVHRDVKLENIFLTSQGWPKLGDFDLAVFDHEAQAARAPVGTIFYMAPEMLALAGPGSGPGQQPAQSGRRLLGAKLDVWSLGVCLFELVAGYKPYQGVSYTGVANAVLTDCRADLPLAASPDFCNLMDAMLARRPEARPSAQELLNHPWIVKHCGGQQQALARQLAEEQERLLHGGKPSGGQSAVRSSSASHHLGVPLVPVHPQPLKGAASLPLSAAWHVTAGPVAAARHRCGGLPGSLGLTMYDGAGLTSSSSYAASPRCMLVPGWSGSGGLASSSASRATLATLLSTHSSSIAVTPHATLVGGCSGVSACVPAAGPGRPPSSDRAQSDAAASCSRPEPPAPSRPLPVTADRSQPSTSCSCQAAFGSLSAVDIVATGRPPTVQLRAHATSKPQVTPFAVASLQHAVQRRLADAPSGPDCADSMAAADATTGPPDDTASPAACQPAMSASTEGQLRVCRPLGASADSSHEDMMTPAVLALQQQLLQAAYDRHAEAAAAPSYTAAVAAAGGRSPLQECAAAPSAPAGLPAAQAGDHGSQSTSPAGGAVLPTAKALLVKRLLQRLFACCQP